MFVAEQILHFEVVSNSRGEVHEKTDLTHEDLFKASYHSTFPFPFSAIFLCLITSSLLKLLEDPHSYLLTISVSN